ncbi:MAG: trehalose-6-phosphate synthase [Gemmatimonadota bacterium]|nr:trehalose-6-phosphate synthase [Gemmatimonadota bacterium]
MRLSLRFILPLTVALALVAYAVVPLVDRLTLRWFIRDIEIRARLIANSVHEPVEELLRAGNQARVVQYFTRLTQDERLFGVAFCASPDANPLGTASVPTEIACDEALRSGTPASRTISTARGNILVSVLPFAIGNAPDGRLVLLHDMSFVQRRSEETRKYLFYFFVALGATVSLITVAIAQLSWRGLVQGMRALLRGEGLLRPAAVSYPAALRPIAQDLRALIRDLEADHQVRDHERLSWTPEALRTILRGDLSGEEVLVVSNREPVLHERLNGTTVTRRPASGVVTALEPVMRACSGTWIAHGSGSADREAVDAHDRVGVPARNPAYQIRRVWLTPEDEAGYYYGFANEGLWPLCHIAHVRPTFRAADWDAYVRVNKLFARAVVEEAHSSDPIVLVQDYHLALVPRLIREALPAATIITFWHIPWPNPEAFSICPWRAELLDGLLGSSILGFHTRFHCNNFIDTVDRQLEALADRETFTVTFKGDQTAVKRYPISVEWPPAPEVSARAVEACRLSVRARHGLPVNHALGIGVDRLDYTKGIEERFRSVERLLAREPEWVGRFSLIQVAAPTRTRIGEYQAYEERVRALVARINAQYPGAAHPPIILLVSHHEPDAVAEYYRAADVCMVTSLHDGMNLVAKEFVSSRDDSGGVLILSQFTGAARELPEALIVNPYDIEECASALHAALTMPPAEQRERMRLMRGLVSEFNVFRWAGRMLLDAAAIRKRARLLRRDSTFESLRRGVRDTLTRPLA